MVDVDHGLDVWIGGNQIEVRLEEVLPDVGAVGAAFERG